MLSLGLCSILKQSCPRIRLQVLLLALLLLPSPAAFPSFVGFIDSYRLPEQVKQELTTNLQILSEDWVQEAVDAANSILSNTTYLAPAWRDFFLEYFGQNPFTDHLRSYLGYPVFWWFSYQAHFNLQQGLVLPLKVVIDRIISNHEQDLSEALTADPYLLQTLMNSLRFLDLMVNIGVIGQSTKVAIYHYYKGLVKQYPNLLKSTVTFDVAAQLYLATIRAQIFMNFRDTLSLTPQIKDDIAGTIDLIGPYLEVWNDFSVLIHDNNGFDTEQLTTIHALLSNIPSSLHNLGSITQNDLLGNTGVHYQFFVTESAVNIFDIDVGAIAGNEFPDDVSPMYSDAFTIVLTHEVNHVVDAYCVSQEPALANRKQELLNQAGNESMEYLRSMFPDGFFQEYPQEFFASISNQWFSNSTHTLVLGLTRFMNGYHEPINQFLFFAEVYSGGENYTLFYTLDTEGRVNRTAIPVTRDAFGHIDSLTLGSTTYTFTLDDSGNVLSFKVIYT